MKNALYLIFNTTLSMFAGVGLTAVIAVAYWLMKTQFAVGG